MQLRSTRLTAISSAVKKLFSPANLFNAGEQGVWYDPSDFSTMFQDAAGTTPVTAVEQPVGLILDKSRGPGPGPELVTNGDFSNGTTGWTSASTQTALLTEAGGLLTLTTNSSTGYGSAVQSIPLIVGKTYRITATLRSVSNGYPAIGLGGESGVIFKILIGPSSFSTRNTFSSVFTYTGGVLVLSNYSRNTSGISEFDNISVRELPGNHATQTTATSRPVLSARVNLLTATETLATQTVTTRATTQTLRFDGAGTVTLSGTATGTYSAGSHSIATTAGNLTLTVSGSVTKADLRAANDALNQPAYQRVNTATDYDTTGFKPYLRFDGADDWLVTPSIDFTSTDKMTAFAGVRKLSDGGTGVVAELSSDINTNNQCFTFLAPSAAGSYRFFSRATVLQGAGTGSFAPAPDTSVITGIGDISGDIVSIRRNGSLIETNTLDQGTGNYGNYPLYIGRRGSTAFPFNGRLYGLIVRGAQSTAQQITSTETWMNQKTGAY